MLHKLFVRLNHGTVVRVDDVRMVEEHEGKVEITTAWGKIIEVDTPYRPEFQRMMDAYTDALTAHDFVFSTMQAKLSETSAQPTRLGNFAKEGK